jgi:hypothetical protein
VIEAIPGGSEHRSWWLEFGGILILLLLSSLISSATTRMQEAFVMPTNPSFNKTDYQNSHRAKKAVEFLELLKTPAEQYISFMEKFPPSIASIKGEASNEYVADIVSNPDELYFQAT